MTVENISWSISTKERCRPSRGQTRILLITSQTRIQLSHRGRHTDELKIFNPCPTEPGYTLPLQTV